MSEYGVDIQNRAEKNSLWEDSIRELLAKEACAKGVRAR